MLAYVVHTKAISPKPSGYSREPLYVDDYFKHFTSSPIADNLYCLVQYACAWSVQLETSPGCGNVFGASLARNEVLTVQKYIKVVSSLQVLDTIRP